MRDTPAEFARKMSRLATDITHTDTRVVKASALAVKTSVQVRLRAAVPSGKLNVGKKGARVSVRYDLISDSEARVGMTGPAQLVESDTQPHRVPRDKVGRGRRRRDNKKLIYIPGIGVRAYANHPGTKGKHPWKKGLAASRPLISKAAAHEYFAPIRRIF